VIKAIKTLIRKLLFYSERVAMRIKRSSKHHGALTRAFVDLILLPTDVYKILYSYRNRFGRFPNLISPKGFNESLQRSKLANRSRLHTIWADKLLVRDYVRKVIGDQYLTKLFWSGDSLSEADTSRLPDRFVVKANQGSGTNLIVHNKTAVNWAEVEKLTQSWLLNDHSVHFSEWQYRWIPPQLLIEELLGDEVGEIPLDYKFFVFRGKVKLLQIDFDRFTAHRRNLYDRDFRLLPLQFEYPNYLGDVLIPKCFSHMVELAERLGSGHSFIRVDFYEFKDQPIFGEITLHPEAGLGRFHPEDWDQKLGLWFSGNY
jgi:hypothetical protein